jgi:shikimate dehydrogenase
MNMPALTGQTRLAGVAGWPVAHSRSPRLHNHWLARYGIDGVYVPLPIPPQRFMDALRGLSACGFAGLNVTIPHKEAAFAACDELDETAQRAGAVNTIVFRHGRACGRNTDGEGFVANLRANRVDPAAGPALLLGAGGSARAVAAALMALGVTVTITNRTQTRAEALAATLTGLRVLDWDRRSAALADHALVINATPSGMGDDANTAIDLASASAGVTVADLVYVPQETPLLRAARARGLVAVGGLGMLLHQAVPGFAAWFGRMPEVDDETTALIAADIPLS